MLLSIFYSDIHQLSVLGLFRCRKDERRIGGSILRLVFVDGFKALEIFDRTIEEKLGLEVRG